jgi:hypothetical protein
MIPSWPNYKTKKGILPSSHPAMALLDELDESKEISRVQRLYDACNKAFSSGKPGLPTLRHIRWLQELLGIIFIQFHLIINSLARLEFELKLFHCQNLVLNKQ